MPIYINKKIRNVISKHNLKKEHVEKSLYNKKYLKHTNNQFYKSRLHKFRIIFKIIDSIIYILEIDNRDSIYKKINKKGVKEYEYNSKKWFKWNTENNN